MNQIDVLETMTPQDFLRVPRRAGARQRVPVCAIPRAGVPVRREGRRLHPAVPVADRRRAAPPGDDGSPNRRCGMPLPACSLPAGCPSATTSRSCPRWSAWPGTGRITTISGSSRRICSRTTNWRAYGGLGMCRWWSGRSVPNPVPADRQAHPTCTAGYLCVITRCCGSCGIRCSASQGGRAAVLRGVEVMSDRVADTADIATVNCQTVPGQRRRKDACCPRQRRAPARYQAPGTSPSACRPITGMWPRMI